jgi:hypothetical protein
MMKAILTGCLYLPIDLICLRRHDEIVLVQASDLMRPPVDG